MTPSWYDVLGVDETASADEIRAAWQESIAGLDPTDRRFKQRNRAAEVLLDPARRAAHDADLSADDEDDDDALLAAEPASTVALDKTRTSAAVPVTDEPAPVVVDETDDQTDDEQRAGEGAARSGTGLLVALGVLALVLLVATLVSLVAGGGGSDEADDQGGLPDARQVQAARKAAETAVGPVLSYDYRDLDKSFAAARSFMTPAYQDVYDKNVAGYVTENAPTTKTIVTTEVIDSGIVRTGNDRVDVLLFVNRPTRNAKGDDVSRDQVTMRMLDVDGRWLVDCLVTQPGGTC